MQTSLKQSLNIWDAAALVVGTVIGTGIFLKTAVMTQLLGNPMTVMLAWVCAGVLSCAGAFVYAELGSRFTQVGGEYVYLREAYGGLIGFLFGWARMWIVGPASIAAYSTGAVTFLGYPKVALALALIAGFTILNCFEVKFGGRVQVILTALKLVLIVLIVGGVFVLAPDKNITFWQSSEDSQWTGLSAFGAALVAALWAYDGWNNLPMVAGEVQNPQRNLPRALVLGMFGVITVYLLANLSYFVALPLNEVLTSNSTTHPEGLPVATKAAATFLGTSGVTVMSIVFAISALSAMHGSILTQARVTFAMAVDGLLPRLLTFVHPKTRVPVVAVIFQGLVACVMAMSGSFDQLTDAVVFSSWIFYALATMSLFKWRRYDKLNKSGPSFLSPAFPVLPIVFSLVAVGLLLNTIYVSPILSLMGLGMIAVGVPVYLIARTKRINI